MSDLRISRRQASQLLSAALGGLIVGCQASTVPPSTEGTSSTATTGSGSMAMGTTSPAMTSDAAMMSEPAMAQADGMSGAALLLSDPHVCRGINTCKNKGKKGTTNECAGQGHCATAVAHDCNGLNECRGQGGCGEKPGQNECKGKGACEVPLSDKTWPKARQKFEELMTAAGKPFGAAPAKAAG